MSRKKKDEQLGMPYGTAANRLKKEIMFAYVQHCGDDKCYRCGEKIKDSSNLSVEHKVAWLDSDNPKELFFDLNNIAFSHLNCNSGAARKVNKGNVAPHGTATRYGYGCRCGECRKANTEYKAHRRATTGKR